MDEDGKTRPAKTRLSSPNNSGAEVVVAKYYLTEPELARQGDD